MHFCLILSCGVAFWCTLILTFFTLWIKPYSESIICKTTGQYFKNGSALASTISQNWSELLPTLPWCFSSFFDISYSGSHSSLEDTSLPGTSNTSVDRTKRQLDLSYPDYTSTPSPKLSTSRRRCGAVTRNGSACRRVIVSGRSSCASHSRIQVSHIQDDSTWV